MATCAGCGKDVSGDFAFCPFCGTPLPESAARGRETRKVVTILFCDLTGSTELGEPVHPGARPPPGSPELGERLDPDALRSLLAQYFERRAGIVERHGGSVEKFIGDAVM